jgi:hypothetical protein
VVKLAGSKSKSSKSKSGSKTTNKTSRKKTAKKNKKAATKKSSAKKTDGKKKTNVKKASAKKAASSKSKAGKSTPKKSKPKKSTAKKSKPKKSTAKKSTTKKSTAKKASARKKTGIMKSTARKTSKAVQDTAKKLVDSIKDIVSIKPPFSAYDGIKPYLFCSYAHSDMNEVFKIINKINQMGYRIWYDEGITPGIEWPEAIGRALLKCDQYIVFMTPNAINSRNVRNEINLAYSKEKDLLVIFLEPTRLSGGMQLQLGTVHCIKKYELTSPQFYSTLDKVLKSDLKN